MHKKTLALLEFLGHYKWDAKVVLALASFAHSFASFSLILQLQSDDALAVSLAIVKQLPRAILKPKFKALSLLVSTMLKLTKIIVQFEGVSLHHELLDNRALDIVKTNIYIASYWIFRSILVCSLQFPDLRPNLSLEQVHVLSLFLSSLFPSPFLEFFRFFSSGLRTGLLLQLGVSTVWERSWILCVVILEKTSKIAHIK